MKNVYYWSPCLNKVGTYKATINSAVSLAKYANNNFSVKLINVCGEWENEKDFLNKKKINVIDLGPNYFKFLPKTGFFKSRISYILIFLFSIFPLTRLLIKEKPDFLIIHLITSLPLILMKILKLNTKVILRISGFPKLNFLRKFLWKFISKKLFKISCPSAGLMKQLYEKKIFNESKLLFLPDPIIEAKLFSKKSPNINFQEGQNLLNEDFFISAGRLTKQKNFGYLLEEFKEFLKENSNYKLLIFGEGEQKKYLMKKIMKDKMERKVFLMGHSNKIFGYMRKAKAFILSSLWEDPGFVIIEAAMNNLSVISSDCKNGPVEFLEKGQAGFLYKTNKKGALKDAIKNFIDNKNNLKNKKILAKKNCLKYTLFRHSQTLQEILAF